MKSLKKLMMPAFSILIVSAAIALISCTGNNTSKDDQVETDASATDNTTTDKEVKLIKANFTSMDPGVSAYIKSLLQNYFGIKNALIEGDSKKAASASKSIYNAMKGFEKSLLTTEQKKAYDPIEDNLKEHADQIAKSKIEEQRQHFAAMSKDMYAIVNAFGAGMTLYHDHCPMYNNGSMWLSETKDIRNPYYGEKMKTCGSVEEMFQ